MKRPRNSHGTISLATTIVLLSIGISSFAGTVEAATSYSYIDNQGNPVLTDRLENVPVEYRSKVKRFETGNSGSTTRGAVDSASVGKAATPSTLQGLLSTIAEKVPHNMIPGLTQYQSAVLILGGGAGLFLLVMLFLSSNPAMTLLAKWMLVFVGITSAYFMYFTDGGTRSGRTLGASGAEVETTGNILQDMKSKTQESIRLQEERTTQQVN